MQITDIRYLIRHRSLYELINCTVAFKLAFYEYG